MQSLILSKENKFKRRKDLSNHLCIGLSTLNNWTREYLKHGLDYFITINTGGHPKSTISAELHQALSEKVHDSSNPFLSYVEAVQWGEGNFNQDLKYTTLRRHMVKHFRTKPKTPRKSIIKRIKRLLKLLKKIPEMINPHRISLNKDKYDLVNLYFRMKVVFGLKTCIGKCITAMGVKPIVNYQHAFKNTYLYGSFSPINGDSFVWEIMGWILKYLKHT